MHSLSKMAPHSKGENEHVKMSQFSPCAAKLKRETLIFYYCCRHVKICVFWPQTLITACLFVPFSSGPKSNIFSNYCIVLRGNRHEVMWDQRTRTLKVGLKRSGREWSIFCNLDSSAWQCCCLHTCGVSSQKLKYMCESRYILCVQWQHSKTPLHIYVRPAGFVSYPQF